MSDTEELLPNDHRRLGRELDLFTFSDTVGRGLPLWTPKGATVRRELERFIVDEEIKRGYQHVYTPDIANLELYKKSGHYPYYKDSMYAPIAIDDELYMLRPMTCPHHFELYLSRPRSYKELPMRIAETAKLYRYEQSGELSGLVRVRSFCLADAHIICADNNQVMAEVDQALQLIEDIAHIFGLKQGDEYSYRLSLGDQADTEKYYQDNQAWDKAESVLRKVLQKRKSKFVEAEGHAAFYGPKIDIQMKNINGKDETAFTVQYDFVMPKRFNLNYINPKGETAQALVIHRSSIGAIERTIAFLLEHFEGALPLWLSPVQVALLPISEKILDYAQKVESQLKNAGIRVELNDSAESLGKKIRNSETQKIPYMLILGEKEAQNGTISVRGRGEEDLGSMKLNDFLTLTKEKIENHSLKW